MRDIWFNGIVKYVMACMLFCCVELCIAQPANNSCQQAESLDDQLWHTGNNVNATYDCNTDLRTSNCTTPQQTIDMCCGIEGIESSIWYLFTVPTTQLIYIDFRNILCSPVSFFGTTTTLQGLATPWQGTCLAPASAVVVQCFNATTVADVMGQMSFTATGGLTYYIELDTKKNSFSSCSSCATPSPTCHSTCNWEIRLRPTVVTAIKDFNVTKNENIVSCDWFYDFQENYSHFKIERKNLADNTMSVVYEGPVENFLHEGFIFHYKDYSVTQNGQYVYTLYGRTDGENYKAVASKIVSIQDIQNLEAFIIPNPADEQIKIMLRNSGNAEALCEIYSSLGEKVNITYLAAGTKYTMVDTSIFPPGIYFVKIILGNKIIVKKLILQ